MKLFAGQQQTQTENRLVDSNGETDRKSRLMDSGVGRKEREGCMERVTWKLILPYVK